MSIREYRQNCTLALPESTLVQDISTVQQFLQHLSRRRRTLGRIGLVDM